MRRLLIPLGFAAATAIAFVAATPEPRGPDDPFSAVLDRSDVVALERRTLKARRDSVFSLSSAIHRAATRQVASVRVRALPRDLGSYHVSVDADVPAITRDSFASRLAEEFASLPAQARVPLRVFVTTDSTRWSFYERAVVTPTSADAPCVVMVRIGSRPNRAIVPVRTDRVVGTCAFYARFGMPGAPIADWLAKTQGLSAISDLPPSNPQRSEPRVRLTGREVARAAPIAACLAGQDEPCVDVFFSAIAWTGLSGPYADLPSAQGVFRASPVWANGRVFSHLANLRASLGDERFGQFWRSPLPPALAYENLEGRPIAEFVRGELLSEVEPYRPGPLHAGFPLALGVAIGAAFGVWAIRRTPRDRS